MKCFLLWFIVKGRPWFQFLLCKRSYYQRTITEKIIFGLVYWSFKFIGGSSIPFVLKTRSKPTSLWRSIIWLHCSVKFYQSIQEKWLLFGWIPNSKRHLYFLLFYLNSIDKSKHLTHENTYKRNFHERYSRMTPMITMNTAFFLSHKFHSNLLALSLNYISFINHLCNK